MKNSETLNLNGYHWFGNNRTSLHQNVRRGVGAFVKSSLLEQYSCVIDIAMEDVISLSFNINILGISSQCVYATYHLRDRRGDVMVKHFIVT